MIDLMPRARKSVRMFCSVVSLTFILGDFSAFGAETLQPFADLKADVDLDIEDGEFELMFTFTLGAGSNGIDPAAEMVSLQVSGGKAAFSVTIPAGSFKKDKSGRFIFQGTINNVRMAASIRPLRGNTFQFEIEGERVDLKRVANPVTVDFAIGDDSGSRSVRAKIE